MTDYACQCRPSNAAAINSAALQCVAGGVSALQPMFPQLSLPETRLEGLKSLPDFTSEDRSSKQEC